MNWPIPSTSVEIMKISKAYFNAKMAWFDKRTCNRSMESSIISGMHVGSLVVCFWIRFLEKLNKDNVLMRMQHTIS